MPSQVCQGTTKKNKPCTKRTLQGAYCHLHRSQNTNVPEVSESHNDSDEPKDLETPVTGGSTSDIDIEILSPVTPADNQATMAWFTLSAAIKSEQSSRDLKNSDIKVEESEEKEFVPKPLRRSNTIWNVFSRQFAALKPTSRNTKSTSVIANPHLEPEKVLIHLGFSPTTRNDLLIYLNKTRQSKEHIYIAVSQPNEFGQHRIKIGRTSDLPRRERDYEKCHMKIVSKFRMDHTIRVENVILKAIKGEFKAAGKKSPIPVIQKIESLGRSVKCPCGGKHNDMFLTIPNYEYNTHYAELEQFVEVLCGFERLETEDFFHPELHRTPLESLVPEIDGGGDSTGTPAVQGGAGGSGRPVIQKATSEERALQIEEELRRNKRTDHPAWVRGPTGRLARPAT